MKLGSKNVFKMLFIITGVVTLWVGALFVSKVVMYFRFSHYAAGEAVHWGVISLEENKHRVCVDYHFNVGDEKYTAQHMFTKPTYPNFEAATYAVESMESENVSVWYLNRGKGKTPISIVNRQFPYNEMMRLIIVFAIYSYFFFLKRYFYHFQTGGAVDESPLKGKKLPS